MLFLCHAKGAVMFYRFIMSRFSKI